MTQFNHVCVVKAANIYFEGKVNSRTLLFADGSRKTLGLMLPGEYEFSSTQKEIMEILAGEVQVCLPNSNWKNVEAGQSFEVPENTTFQLKVKTPMDYCCSYI